MCVNIRIELFPFAIEVNFKVNYLSAHTFLVKVIEVLFETPLPIEFIILLALFKVSSLRGRIKLGTFIDGVAKI